MSKCFRKIFLLPHKDQSLRNQRHLVSQIRNNSLDSSKTETKLCKTTSCLSYCWSQNTALYINFSKEKKLYSSSTQTCGWESEIFGTKFFWRLYGLAEFSVENNKEENPCKGKSTMEYWRLSHGSEDFEILKLNILGLISRLNCFVIDKKF